MKIAVDTNQPTVQERIIALMREVGRPMGPKEVASRIEGSTYGNVRGEMVTLFNRGELERLHRGLYQLVTSKSTQNAETQQEQGEAPGDGVGDGLGEDGGNPYLHSTIETHPHREPPSEPDNPSSDGGRNGYRMLSLLPYGHGAGPGRINPEAHIQRFSVPREWIRARYGRDVGDGYLVRVFGSSMEPGLRDGQEVYVEFSHYGGPDRYVIDMVDDGYEIKRVERIGERHVRLTADNRAYRSATYEHVEDDLYRDVETGLTRRFRIIGRVLADDSRTAAVHEQAELQGITFAHVIAGLFKQFAQPNQ